jgi:hypothetical protein
MTTSRTAPPSSALPAADAGSEFSLTVHLYKSYQQIVDFHLPGVAVLGVDESPPLGHGWGPSPMHMVGSALGACLAGALLRVLRDAGVTVIDLHTRVRGTMRNDTLGRTRALSLTVRLTPVVASRADLAALPSPERLAQLSMVADMLRGDLALWIAIDPEVRSDTEVTHSVTPPSRLGFATAAPAPHFYEPMTP